MPTNWILTANGPAPAAPCRSHRGLYHTERQPGEAWQYPAAHGRDAAQLRATLSALDAETQQQAASYRSRCPGSITALTLTITGGVTTADARVHD